MKNLSLRSVVIDSIEMLKKHRIVLGGLMVMVAAVKLLASYCDLFVFSPFFALIIFAVIDIGLRVFLDSAFIKSLSLIYANKSPKIESVLRENNFFVRSLHYFLFTGLVVFVVVTLLSFFDTFEFGYFINSSFDLVPLSLGYIFEIILLGFMCLRFPFVYFDYVENQKHTFLESCKNSYAVTESLGWRILLIAPFARLRFDNLMHMFSAIQSNGNDFDMMSFEPLRIAGNVVVMLLSTIVLFGFYKYLVKRSKSSQE